jgi:hypothetical protein
LMAGVSVLSVRGRCGGISKLIRAFKIGSSCSPTLLNLREWWGNPWGFESPLRYN